MLYTERDRVRPAKKHNSYLMLNGRSHVESSLNKFFCSFSIYFLLIVFV